MEAQEEKEDKNEKSLTYLTFLHKVIQDYEKSEEFLNRKEHSDANEIRKNYTLYEDIKILSEFGQKTAVTVSDYKILSQKLNQSRTIESLKCRFQDYLLNLRKEDLNLILAHAKTKRLSGFLIFDTVGEKKVLKTISDKYQTKENPAVSNIQKKKPPTSISKKKTAGSIMPVGSNMQVVGQKIANMPKESEQAIIPEQNSLPKNLPKRKPIQKIEDLQLLYLQKNKENIRPVSKESLDESNELNLTLGILEELSKKQKRELIKLLDQLSGDLSALSKYLMNNSINGQKFWTADEDQILEKFYNLNACAEEFRQLKSLKGEKWVFKRVQYLRLGM